MASWKLYTIKKSEVQPHYRTERASCIGVKYEWETLKFWAQKKILHRKHEILCTIIAERTNSVRYKAF